ncbi:unnamed protein product, partial [Vicia faba]
VPFHVWNSEFFVWLANSIGSFVCCDENMMKTKNMDIAMILVRTIGFLSLNVTVEVEICGKLFKVRLTEDTHNPLRISFNLTKQEVKMVDSSSDSKVDWNKGGDVNGEAKFNESLMEESLFSDDIKGNLTYLEQQYEAKKN